MIRHLIEQNERERRERITAAAKARQAQDLISLEDEAAAQAMQRRLRHQRGQGRRR